MTTLQEPPRTVVPAVSGPRLPDLAITSDQSLAGAFDDGADPRNEPEHRRSSGLRNSDVFSLLGAAGAAFGFTALLFNKLAPLSGVLGFIVVSWCSFILFYGLLVSLDESGPAVRDRLASVLVHSLAFLLLCALVVVVVFTLVRGRRALLHTNFFTQDVQNAGPLQPLSVGGILHAIVGTLEQIGLSLLFSVPLGLVCAVFLNEVPGRFSRFVRTIVEAMTALPSIVAGLFIYASVILILHQDKSGFAAALALTVMMLPIIIRAADVVIRLVPGTLREASLATGASQWRTVWHVVLPTARSGLATAVILGAARGIGETSPVLLTAGYTAAMNANPFVGPQVSLPLATFEFVRSPQPNVIARGFGAAATLLLLVLVLFIVARLIGGRAPGVLTKRQERRRAAASRRDARRFRASEFSGTDHAYPPTDEPSDPTRPEGPAL
ncbi:MAG: phosphate transporter permease PstA [Frankiales bacterium]|nr:phosphate transporter permease PstA [Frankiales bacterium]